MLAAALDSGTGRCSRRGGVAVDRSQTATSSGLPSVSVPVLSKATMLTPCATLQRLGVLDQDAVARGDAGAGHDRGRRGQAQRAGAGDHEHRHGVEDAPSPSRRAKPPAEQRDQRDADDDRHEHLLTRSTRRWIGAFLACADLDQPDDARQRGFGADGGGAHHAAGPRR